MLKRKDLSKDFELIVKQEIKNHNDSILNTNMSIERFKSDLNNLKKSIEKESAIRDSQFTSLRIDSVILYENDRDLLEKKIDSLKLIVKIYEKKVDDLIVLFRNLEYEISKNIEIDR